VVLMAAVAALALAGCDTTGLVGGGSPAAGLRMMVPTIPASGCDVTAHYPQPCRGQPGTGNGRRPGRAVEWPRWLSGRSDVAAGGTSGDTTTPVMRTTPDALARLPRGEMLDQLHQAGIDAKTKVQAPNAPAGKFTKDHFAIDLGAQQVTCPTGVTARIRPVRGHARHAGEADFGSACGTCPLRARCTDAKTGRGITIGHHEARFAAARAGRPTPPGAPTTAPPAPRSNARSPTSCAAAVNLARLATLRLTHTTSGWAINPA
jgi:hypothetical protein